MSPSKIVTWDKLDEVAGAGMLTCMAIISMAIGYDSGVTQMCVTGIVALLAVKIGKPNGDE